MELDKKVYASNINNILKILNVKVTKNFTHGYFFFTLVSDIKCNVCLN